MRSALWQALDILDEEADAEQLLFLACTIADLVAIRFRADRDTSERRAAWDAADGRGRVRMVLAEPQPCFLVDGTEPEPVLRRLGLVPPRTAPHPDGGADDR